MAQPLRWIAAVLAAAASFASSATAFSTDYTDLWWNPAESGWGLNLIQQHDTLFATLFVYGPDNGARWFVASSLTPGSAANAFSGALFQTSGPSFGAAAFDPAAVNVTQVGTLSVAFASATQGTLTYNVGGVSVTKAITRQTWRTDSIAGSYRGGLVASGPGCASGTNPGGTVEAFDRLVVTANGAQVAFRVDFNRGATAATCTYSGTYSQAGRLGAISAGAFTCTSGGAAFSQGAFTMTELQSSVHGFTAAFAGNDAACGFTGRFGGVREPGSNEVAASGLSPFPPSCSDVAGAYINAEVEPHIVVNPRDANHWVGNWQQDRFSNGASRGLVTGVSFDGGRTWTLGSAPFSHCTGGNALNGGDYLRATDPWLAFSPDGTVHQSALALSGASFTPQGRNAMLASRSTDGGLTWSAPIALIRDSGSFFNDKETITADPNDARFVYATWDRLEAGAGGPSYFARTLDAGLSWETARAIYDPGGSSQTIGNLIRVLPDGTLVNLFTRLDDGPGNSQLGSLHVIRSTDRGATWSAPVRIDALSPLGARDPVTSILIRDGSILAQMAVAPNGTLYVVWQDGRFTQARDGIALSRSADGGLTWSAPVRVNADPSVVAFLPQVHVLADGTVGVTYYDLRSNTADPERLLTDYWLARSRDGVQWIETRVTQPFDLRIAPLAGSSLFIGDYMGLAGAGADFVPFYARTGDTTNRTDIFASRIGPDPRLAVEAGALAKHGEAGSSYRAVEMPVEPLAPAFERAVSENLVRAMESRVPGWSRAKRPR